MRKEVVLKTIFKQAGYMVHDETDPEELHELFYQVKVWVLVPDC